MTWPWEATGLALGMIFLAGLLRGFTGFGFSLAAVPLLSLIMPPAQAVPVVLLLQSAVGVAGLQASMRIADWRSVRTLALGAAAVTPVGTWGLAHLPAAPVRLMIAAVVLAGAAVLARGFRMRVALAGPGLLLFGMASGLFNGLAGLSGPPVIAFYLASPVTSSVARASMTVFFLAASLPALASLALLGLLDRSSVAGAVLGLPAVLVGSWLGTLLYRNSADRRYRPVALALLLATAALSVWRAALDYVA